MQRQNGKIFGAGLGTDRFDGARNFIRAGHENQHIAFCAGADRAFKRIGGGFPDGMMIKVDFFGGVRNLDRKHTAFRFEFAARREIITERSGIERSRHDDNFQVGARFLKVECAGEGDVTVKVAFMKFVEDNGGNTAQFGIAENLA